jgi:hypothetical protein
LFATLSVSDEDISCQLRLLYYPADLSRNNAPDPVATGQTSTMAVKAMLEGDSYGPYVLRQGVEAIGRICDQLKDAERQLARFVNCTTRPDAA